MNRQKVIFEEFKRLDSHQTRAEKGLGLGLAIADGFCRVLEHPLNVRSWPHRGTVFSVSVPLGNPVEPKIVVPEEPAAPTTQSLVVLCIDNEDSILVGMHSLLSRWGMQSVDGAQPAGMRTPGRRRRDTATGYWSITTSMKAKPAPG